MNKMSLGPVMFELEEMCTCELCLNMQYIPVFTLICLTFSKFSQLSDSYIRVTIFLLPDSIRCLT